MKKGVNFVGRDAYIANEAMKLSGKDDLIEALDAAIDIYWGRPAEQRATSDMLDMERLLSLLVADSPDYQPAHESTRRMMELVKDGIDPFGFDIQPPT